MPFYEYRCGACGHELEVLQKIADEPLRECPTCGVPDLVRLISAPAFRLKGGGWYETDFKSSNKRNLAEGSGEKQADTPKADSGKAAPAPPAPAKTSGEGSKT